MGITLYGCLNSISVIILRKSLCRGLYQKRTKCIIHLVPLRKRIMEVWVWLANMVMLLTEGFWCNCASCTLSSNKEICKCTPAVQRFVAPTITYWFLHSFSWLVPINVGHPYQMSAELPTDHHLDVCNLRLGKQSGLARRCRSRSVRKLETLAEKM